MHDKEIIRNLMKQHFNNTNIKLPGGIRIFDDGNAVRIELCCEKIINNNMQEDENAFEAWSVGIHLASKKPIILDTDGRLDYDRYEEQNHLCRFLYRVLRFQEQYSWFGLSPYLQDEITRFDAYINDEGNTFFNNIPGREAGTKADRNTENLVEGRMANNGIPGFESSNPINRQLPVGLFKRTTSAANNRVFTGKKSAIDLWTWKDSEFILFELKAEQKKAGIITEIFFYSNYMRDLLCRHVFTLNRDVKTSDEDPRGYKNILNRSFDAITGVMLANVYHPLITQEFLDTLNNNGCEIRYEKLLYDIDAVLQ